MALLRPCATSAGFTVTPEAPRRMDMVALRRRLEGAGYVVVVDARIILVVREPSLPGGGSRVELSLYDNGRVLLKTVERDVAQRAYAQVEPLLG